MLSRIAKLGRPRATPEPPTEFWDPLTIESPRRGALDEYRMQEQHLFCFVTPRHAPCLQVGVPNWARDKFGPNWVSIDLFDTRPCIDHRMDVCRMDTFADETFDAVWCCAVLEHVRDPFAAAREISRVTRQGGEIWIEVPFVQPYHPTGELHTHGGDFWRFTPEGIIVMFPDFEANAIGAIDGGGILFHASKRLARYAGEPKASRAHMEMK
jgi:SAM-dependent methyltransferase